MKKAMKVMEKSSHPYLVSKQLQEMMSDLVSIVTEANERLQLAQKTKRKKMKRLQNCIIIQ